MGTAPALRLFNALNGAEIREIIKREIASQLDHDTNFGQHITYPVVEWKWHLEVKAYPHEPGHFEAQGGGSVHAREGEALESSKPVDAKSAEPVEMSFEGGRSATAPDAVRSQEGMEVPENLPGGRKPHEVAKSVTIKKGADVRTGAQRARDSERK